MNSDMVWLLAFAAVSIASNSTGVTRTRRVPALALPLGSGGRPAFLGFFCGFKASELLYDCRSDGICRRFDRSQVQNSDMMLGIGRIVCLVSPCVDCVRLGVLYKVEDLNIYCTPISIGCQVFLGYNF